MNFLETMRGILKEEGLPVPSVPSKPLHWLTAWRAVVALTRGITIEDPRLPGIMEALQQCDAAFEQDDWTAFQRAAEAVRQAVQGGG